MAQPTTRRISRLEVDPVESCSTDRSNVQTPVKTRRRGWPVQSVDSFASNMHQPHFALNLFSIVFFCAGCLMLLMSSHQRVIKLVMSDCHSSKTMITETTDKFMDRRRSSLDSRPFLQTGQTEKGGGGGGGPEELRIHSAPDLLDQSGPGNSPRKIEFVVPGNLVPFPESLQLGSPYTPVEDVNYEEIQELEETERDENDNSNEKTVRLFIGITSACCNEKSKKSRNEIRETWMKRSRQKYPDIDIKFFISQPSSDKYTQAVDLLTEEADLYDDLVLVRGLDVYDNLPNKTFGMLKYTLAASQKYTHFLKTDDDSYVRVHKLLESLHDGNGFKMDRVYKGCLENRSGFYPIRDTNSKWYLKYDEFDDFMAQPIRGTKYLAGWGYVLSRDVMFHAMKKVYSWDNDITVAPSWYLRMKWEDVMMGALVADLIPFPDADFRFKAAWRACTNETAIRHLDLDAPALFQGLYAQDQSGLWEKKTVQCSSGTFVAGDYSGWKRWRNSVIEKAQRI
eukprot:g4738.t1